MGLGLKVIFDPGGITDDAQLDDLLNSVYLIKPNEHEAKTLTGISVIDLDTARQAADKLMEAGAQNVLITVGKDGAYLFTPHSEKHIAVPEVDASGAVKDETGCGDQTTATLCAYLQAGKLIEEAVEIAILSGTLQFHKSGIQPVTREELTASREQI